MTTADDFLSPVQSLRSLAQTQPERPFLTQPLADGTVRVYSYQQTFDCARRVAQAFRHYGLQQGQRVGILSKNCAEWFIIDWAAQLAGLISVPLFPTQSTEKLNAALQEVPVQWLFIGKLDDPGVIDGLKTQDITTVSLPYDTPDTDLSWQTLTAVSPLPSDAEFQAKPGDIMTIHFTSGTSGHAKGVALSYGAYHYACRNTQNAMTISPEDRMLSYLPAAHIAERMMIQGNAVYSGAQLFFAHALSTFAQDLKRAQPTAFMSVPRLWKNFQSAMLQKLPPWLFHTLLSLPGVNRLLRRLIRHLLGLTRARLTGSGAAAMPEDLLRWYEKLGIPIAEAWGMTETCGLATMNFPYRSSARGTVGRAVPGTDIRLSDAGELLIRSPGLFSGYMNDPKATARAFDSNGYFRTGDRGRWNEQKQGWELLGRLNDQFKTSKGKFVNPTPIENRLQEDPLIEQACVFGEYRAQPVAVVQLSGAPADSPHLRQTLQQLLRRINAPLEAYERLEALVVAAAPWTVASGCITPTMKIRRQYIADLYQPRLPDTIDDPVSWS